MENGKQLCVPLNVPTFAIRRRHGIKKWPGRKKLLKAAKAQKEAAKKSLACSKVGAQAQEPGTACVIGAHLQQPINF